MPKLNVVVETKNRNLKVFICDECGGDTISGTRPAGWLKVKNKTYCAHCRHDFESSTDINSRNYDVPF